MWGSPAAGGWAVIGSSTAAEIRSLRESSRRGRRLRAASRRRLSSRKSTLGACRSNGFDDTATKNAIAHLAQDQRSRSDQYVSSPPNSASEHFSDTLLAGLEVRLPLLREGLGPLDRILGAAQGAGQEGFETQPVRQ